jgi:hypothetical protein
MLLGVVGLVAVARVAVAAPPPGDPAAVAKVTALNKKALDAYGKQDYDTAKALLKQALDVCADAGLDQHPITARTHIHFGVVAIVGFKQHEVGIKQFRKAIEIEPDIKLTKSLVTPELQDAFEEAVLAGNGSGGGEAAPAAGGDDNGGGAAAAPAEGGEAAAAGGDDDEGTPKPKPKPRKKHGDDDDDNGKGKNEEGPGQKGTFFVALTLGSGAGIASGSGEVYPAMHNLAAAGFALSQLGQIKPEVGYFVSPDFLLSLALRFQYINGLNGEVNPGCPGGFCKPYSTALAVLAKATWLFGDGPLHFTAGGQVGGGYIRHAEVFNSDQNCSPSAGSTVRQGCVDTIKGGPFLIGPTAGILYEIGDSLDLIAGLNTELGLSKFTFNLDIDVGIGVRL